MFSYTNSICYNVWRQVSFLLTLQLFHFHKLRERIMCTQTIKAARREIKQLAGVWNEFYNSSYPSHDFFHMNVSPHRKYMSYFPPILRNKLHVCIWVQYVLHFIIQCNHLGKHMHPCILHVGPNQNWQKRYMCENLYVQTQLVDKNSLHKYLLCLFNRN